MAVNGGTSPQVPRSPTRSSEQPDHLLAQAVAGLAVDLVETGLLGLARSRAKGDRAGHQREFEIPFQ